jgi:hypothetical protein
VGIKGQVGLWNDDVIVGWMMDRESGPPIELEVVIDGKVVGKTLADSPRPDVAKATGTDGNCGFQFAFPPGVDRKSRARARLRFAGSNLYIEPSIRSAVRPEEESGATRATIPAIPGAFRSSFGGLWIDRADWMDILAEQHRHGEISDAVADQIARFNRDGYVVLQGAVPAELVEIVNAEIDRFWREPPKGLFISTTEPDGKAKVVPPKLAYREGKTKLLDAYVFSAAARRAVANPASLAFLNAVFGEMPKAFQGLSFWNGSEQEMHKDTAYVRVRENPMALVASWLALEDIEAGTGELDYFVGSHRAPDYLFGGTSKWMVSEAGDFSAEHKRFLASLHEDARKHSYLKKSFLARRGDVLFWHADLAHGGSPVTQKGRSRKSLVTHFCPASLTPNYMNGAVPRAAIDGGCAFVSAHSPAFLRDIETQTSHAA